MELPLKPLLFIALLTTLSFPVPGRAATEDSGYFTAEPATHRVTLTGFTRARATMTLTSRLTERITEISADTGERIGEEGVFARLDPTLAELDLDRNAIEQAKLASKIAYLEKEADRFRTLFKKQSISETKLDSLLQDLDQARLALRTRQNEEKRLLEHLDRHRITAPPGWLVIDRYAEPGEWVGAGTPLAEIGDFRTLVVPFAVNHDEYLRIKRQAESLTLRLPEVNLAVPAKLHTVSPGFDPRTRKINLELRIGRAFPGQRGGIRTDLDVELPDPTDAFLVPATSVNNRYESNWLTRADGKKIPVIVLGPGPEPGTLRVTSDKIEAGDKFIREPESQPAGRE